MAFGAQEGPKIEMKPHMRARELTIRAPMANLCNLDGRIVPESDARIPVLDRGFLFGDSIYEVVRTYRDLPFGWAEHWARLRASADAIAPAPGPRRADGGAPDRRRRWRRPNHGRPATCGSIVSRGTGEARRTSTSPTRPGRRAGWSWCGR